MVEESELMLDPIGDRQVKSVPRPPRFPLSSKRLYDSYGKPNITFLRTFLSDGGKISDECIRRILFDATAIFRQEPNLIKVPQPAVIIGDIHGQFYDMLHMFEKVIDPRGIPKVNLLFLGDYVDRGIYSMEVCVFLFCLKMCHPASVTLLRGNHESRAMTEHFTFRNEILQKFDDQEEIYELFVECFDTLPLAANVNGDYLCMHGGISRELVRESDIDKIDRFNEPPLSGFLCDLLWADPLEDNSARKHAFTENEQRECSVKFGLEPVKKVLQQNNFISIIRAHQVQVDGYKMHRWAGSTNFPTVITLFSAPNYCGSYKNKGAVLVIENQKMNVKQFREVEAPFHLPGDIDVFQWSMPFLAEKITQMLKHAAQKASKLSITDDEISGKELHELLEEQSKLYALPELSEKQEAKRQRLERMRAKVKTVARMSKMFTTLRENQEEIVQIKRMTDDGKLPMGTLLGGAENVQQTMLDFSKTRLQDRKNEGFPTRSRRLSLRTMQRLNIKQQ